MLTIRRHPRSILFAAAAILLASIVSLPASASSEVESRLSTPLINELIVGAIALPGEDLVFEGNVYHCYRDLNHYGRTVCIKAGTVVEPTREPTLVDLAELQAAQQSFELVLPVTFTESCSGSVHGDCSHRCRITAILPNGDAIVECSDR